MIQKIVYLLIAAVLVGCEKQNDTDPQVKKISAVRGYQNWYFGSFRCGVFVPPSYDASKAYPLIVILHGYSDTTSWNYRWYNEPFLSADPSIVLSPKCPIDEEYGWGNSWDPRISPMMQKTFEMMDLIKKAFHLDTSRYYIHGTSMGAIGIYGVLQKNPGLFTAAYLECGSGNPAIAPLLVNTPLWIFHGTEDYVVPVYFDRDMYHAVLDGGGKQIRYTEYPGVGHNVWDYTRYETTLPYWLLAQRKGEAHEAPDTVQSFAVTVTPENRIRLDWTSPAGDQKRDGKVWFYRIYRDGQILKEADNIFHTFTDTSIVSNTSYAYQISVVNFYFRESSRTASRWVKGP